MTPGRKAAHSMKKVSSKSRLGVSKLITSFVEEPKPVVIESLDEVKPDSQDEVVGGQDVVVSDDSKDTVDLSTNNTIQVDENSSPKNSSTPPEVSRAVTAVRNSTVLFSSPLRKVAFTMSSDGENSASSGPAKRKRLSSEDQDQENEVTVFNFDVALENNAKRTRLENGAAKDVFRPPRIVHQSWLDKTISRFSKSVLGLDH